MVHRVARMATITAEKAGPLEWHKKPENIAKTLDVLEALAKSYKDQESLVALELLNEPRWDVPLDILKTFYQDAYHRVRPYLPADRVAIMFHDGFRPMDWMDFMKEAEYSNVILDTHIYQCFTDEDRKRSAPGQIQKAIQDHRTQVETMNEKELPTCVGEWSLGLPGETYAGLSPTAQEGIKRAYAGAQLMAFRAGIRWMVLLDLQDGDRTGLESARLRRTRLVSAKLCLRFPPRP